MTYELINPSDDIVFDAPDVKTAALACLYIGNGKYGAKPSDGGEEVPLLIFGWRDWWKKTYGNEPEAAILENAKAVADCLRTFRMRDGKERSSMNDICKYAHEDADEVELLLKPKP